MRLWLIPALSVGWLGGVLVGSLTTAPTATLNALLVGLAIVYVLSWRAWKVQLLTLALLAGVLGVWRAGEALYADRAERAAWEPLFGETHVVRGVVFETQPRGAFARLTMGNLMSNDQRLPGFLRTTVPQSPGLTERARVTVRGNILRPEELRPPGVVPRGDLERVFSRHQVFAAMRFPDIRVEEPGNPSTLTRVRYRLRDVFLQELPEPAAGLYSAFLLSFDRDLDRDLLEKAAATGILHLVAISGSHIVVIAGACFLAAAGLGFSRVPASVVTLAATAIFLALVGFPESGVRSGIMAGLVLLAYLFGRPAAGLRALLLASALMTIENPRILLGDVGFQLSALAVWGLLVLFPLLRGALGLRSDPFHLSSLFLLTVAAEIATAPVVAYAFGRLPLLGPFTNVLAGVLFLPILAFGALMLGFGLLAPILARLASPLAVALANAFLGIAEVGSRIPGHVLNIPPMSLPWLLFLVIGMIGGAHGAAWWLGARMRSAQALSG